MSCLINSITTATPRIDERLKGKIVIVSSCVIPDIVIAAMTLVIKAIADQLEKENRPFGNGLAISCIFTDEPEFSIRFDDVQIAICVKLAVYPISRMQPYMGDKRLFTILAEELCHIIWDISDEELINYKVIEVLGNIFPDIKMSDFYAV